MRFVADSARVGSAETTARISAALAAGAVSVLTLPPFDLLILVPLAWSALLICLTGTTPRTALVVGFAFGLGQFGAGLFWITESFYVDAQRFGALALPSVAALSAFLAIFPAAASAAFARFSRVSGSGVPAALLLSSTWTCGEWLRGHLLTGFPWNLAGYAVADFDALRQPTAWLGSYGMSFVVVLIGAMPGAAWMARGSFRRAALASAVLLPLALWTFGISRLNDPEPTPTGVSVRVVQGNFPQTEKWRPGAKYKALNRYLSLTAAGRAVDIVLWPETAFPGYLAEDIEARASIAATLPPRTLLMTGVPARVEIAGQTNYYNTVQVYDSSGDDLASYAKHHLVPFGEYTPLPNWLPLDRIVETPGDFTAGSGPRTLVLPGIPAVAPVICYEIIFPGHVIDPQFRAQWIFNATNDAWFGMSIGPKQHFASAKMRAVEEGLPVIRAANTGISAVIDAKGRTVAQMDTGASGTIDAQLPPALPRTLYAQFGDFMLILVLALFWSLAAVMGWCAEGFRNR